MSNIDQVPSVEVPATKPDSSFLRVKGVWQRVKNYSLPAAEYIEKLISKGLHPDGTEDPDPIPMQPPIGFVRQPSMVEHVRAMVRSEQLRMAAEAQEADTFEEAEDFYFPDEEEPFSAYEMEEVFEPDARYDVRVKGREATSEGGSLDAAAGPDAISAPESHSGADPAASGSSK